jgi:VWFA-related protein
VLLLDALNTPLGDQMRVRRKMIDYLGSVKPGTTLAIFTLSTQLRIVTQFTSNPAALVSLLRKPKTNTQQSPLVQHAFIDRPRQRPGQCGGRLTARHATPRPQYRCLEPGIAKSGPMNAAATLQQFQADQIAGQVNARMHITLQAMRQLAGYLGGISGRKNVIWFSGAFPLVLFPDASLPDPFANIAAYRVEVQKTTDMLTAARVAIYPVDASGLWETSEFSAANNPTIPRDLADAQSAQWFQHHQQHYDNQATMQQVADDTGGKAYLETNDFVKAVAGAIENGSSYYTLAYAPKNAVLDGRYRAIKVALDDGHSLKLAYRRGYYADAPEGPSPSDAGPNSAFAAALDHDAPAATEILLKARVLPAPIRHSRVSSFPLARPETRRPHFMVPPIVTSSISRSTRMASFSTTCPTEAARPPSSSP